MHEQFKSAKKHINRKPVTAIDYRKLFIDIDGVEAFGWQNTNYQFMQSVTQNNPK